jgi:hypothetical protein
MASPEHTAFAKPPTTTPQDLGPRRLQRKCACQPAGETCSRCARDEKSLFQANGLPLIAQDALRSPGQPLDETARAFVEPRFGVDFSHVRIHTDSQAAGAVNGHDAFLALQRAAGNRAVTSLLGGSSGKPLDSDTREEMESRFTEDFRDVLLHADGAAPITAAVLGANAWTSGSDIVFGEGFYSPNTIGGKKLLAHELAHVVQQRRGGATPRAFEPASAADRDAASAARQFAGAGPVSVSAATSTGVMRQEAEDPWWKKRLNPIYQRALEVLPQGVAHKLEQANEVAKQFVKETGPSDEGLNQAVQVVEPALKPIADYLGVKYDTPLAPRADDNKPVTWLGTPPIDVRLKQRRDQQATQAALDQTVPGALAPPIQSKNVSDLPPLDVLLRPDPPPTDFEAKLQAGKPFQIKIHPKPDIDPRDAVWAGKRPTAEQMKNMRFEDPNDPSRRIWVDEGKEVELGIGSDSTMPIRDFKTHELKGYRVRHGDTMWVLDRNGEVQGSHNLERPLEHPAIDPIDVAMLGADLGPIAAKGIQAGGKALLEAATKSGARELSEVGGDEASMLLAREASDALKSGASHPREFPEIDLGGAPANDVRSLESPSVRPANDVLPDENVIRLDEYRPQTLEQAQQDALQIAEGQDFAPDQTVAAGRKLRGAQPQVAPAAPPINRVLVGRRGGPSLELQSQFSGSKIRYARNKAYITEAELDGVYFDRIEKNVLGEVKGDYSVPIRIGSQDAADRLVAEAGRQMKVAKKYGLRIEWHVRAEDLAGFQNVVGSKHPSITFVPY